MFVSLRNKKPSTPNLKSSDILNTSVDESRVDSNSSKRFARKHAPNLDGSRIIKTPRVSQGQLKRSFEQIRLPLEAKLGLQGTNLFKNDELFIKISNTPAKTKHYTPLASTDRVTEDTQLRERCETEITGMYYEKTACKKGVLAELQDQLDLKAAEIMLLEDQNVRLKRELAGKESEYLKQRTAVEAEHKKVVRALREGANQLQAEADQLRASVQGLREQLTAKNDQIRTFKKGQISMTREIKGLKYQKGLMEKQIQELSKRKLPKQLRQLMSYREVALLGQVNELREQLQRQKTEREKNMEQEIGTLQQQHCQRDSAHRKLQIHGHVMNKKIVDYEEEIKIKTEQFGRCLSNLKENNDNLSKQLKKTRKENIKLQRLTLLTKNNIKRPNSRFSPDSDTLSLSVSSRSPE